MIVIAIAAALAVPSPRGNEVARWRPLISDASRRCGIPIDWIKRVMLAESRGWTMLASRPIRSPAGAIGLMQLMPATWAEMRARLKLGADPDEPADNILAGACYLRLLYDRFGYPGLFAAYNAGPGRYGAFIDGRQQLPKETRDYMGSVTGEPPRTAVGAMPPPLPAPLFLVRRDVPDTAAAAPEPAPTPTLFAIRKATP